MCRLFGIIANTPVDIEFSFSNANLPFKELSKSNPDGWGYGYYKDQEERPIIFKEGIEDSEFFDFDKSKCVYSKISISHVRKATNGIKTSNNSHPFSYKKYLFAHNGRVSRENIKKNLNEAFTQQIKGETDSEVMFLLLMQFMEEQQNLKKAIKKIIRIVKEYSYTGINFLMSDGENLYAYRDSKDRHNYYSLYYLIRDPKTPGDFSGLSENTKQMIKSKILNNEKSILFCSEMLTKGEENWEKIKIGELISVNSNLEIKKEII